MYIENEYTNPQFHHRSDTFILSATNKLMILNWPHLRSNSSFCCGERDVDLVDALLFVNLGTFAFGSPKKRGKT